MRILGIDPVTSFVGYGLLVAEGNDLITLAAGVVRASRGAGLPERLRDIWEGIRSVIKKSDPQIVAVEEVFLGRNIKSLIQIGEARGVILLAAAAAGIPVSSLSPAEIKKAVTGSGNARKDRVREMVRVILGKGIEAETDDVTDALAVAICQAHRS